ncbi:hypothetical protein INT44_005250 [Umbelopsis vinacea]|uniref:3-hydroxyacyl-CoA dehydrogenase n=1 Tax=Umbelopsis vinacea TaxID=44442 RepID=A0A8H7QA18_9FUNG|nr:hypothetical protein INT44_005250 [Umbelopsis vinacea]
MKISGNTFIVTGGASGLGEAAVRKIVKEGGNAVIIDVNVDGAEKIAQELGTDRVLAPGKVDVTEEEPVKKALELALERFETLAGAVICHGVVGPPQSITGYGPGNALTSYEQMKFVSSINFLGVYNVAQKVAEILIKQEPLAEDGERGAIILISSIAGLDGSLVSYGTTKSAVAGMILPFAREVAPFGVRVMGIAPGVFQTPMTQMLTDNPDAANSILQMFPKRMGQPLEFADLVAFILETPMLNGSVIRIDAGVRLQV